jgi:hypothetical protein
MNYVKTYIALIKKAQDRVLENVYVEKHHIFPLSIFGKNDKIVILSAREHYIAHALLEKICIKRYGITHPKSKKMILAFHCMNNMRGKLQVRYINSHLYKSSKIRFIDRITGIPRSDETKNKLREANLGKITTAETKERISASLNGHIVSEETKKKQSDSYMKKSDSEKLEITKKVRVSHELFSEEKKIEISRKISESSRNPSKEARQKMSDANKGRIASDETRMKLSIAHTNISDETRNKMSLAKKGKPKAKTVSRISDRKEMAKANFINWCKNNPIQENI